MCFFRRYRLVDGRSRPKRRYAPCRVHDAWAGWQTDVVAATANDVKRELVKHGSVKKAKASAWFFKTGPGQYGEGDVFIGVTLPEQRKIAAQYGDLSLTQIKRLLCMREHECRLSALILLANRFKKNPNQRKEIYDLYMANITYVNNWDLVDSSADKIVGEYLKTTHREMTVLKKLARSTSLWERRIAIIATFANIAEGSSKQSLEIAELLIYDDEDLIHKAVGWTLREVGKRCSMAEEEKFLKTYASTMPRTALRYAIERFPESKRRYYMSAKVRMT